MLASIVGDTSGRHDALCGTSTLARNDERYGDGSAAGSDARRPRAVRAGGGQARPRAAATCRRASPSSRASGSTTTAARCSAAPPAPAQRSRCAPSRTLTAARRQRPRTRSTRAELRQHAAGGAGLARPSRRRTRRPALGRHTRGPPRLRQHPPIPDRTGARMTGTLLDDRRPRPRRPGPPSCAPATSSPSSTSTATRPSTSWCTTPHDTAVRYSAPDTIQAQGAHLPHHRQRAAVDSEHTPADDGGRRRGRPARHPRRRLLQGVQHPALRPPHLVAARLRGELPRRGRPVRPGQARPGLQHQLVHERAGRAGRRPRHRRRHLRARACASPCAPSATSWSLVSNCPQINNPCNGFDPTPVRDDDHRRRAAR